MALRVADNRLSPRRLRKLIVSAALVVAAIIAANAIVIAQLHVSTLREVQDNLLRQSLTLSEITERTFKTVDLVLASVAERARTDALTESGSQQLAAEEYHSFLAEKKSELPQILSMGILDASGNKLNHSHDWPVAPADLSSRSYFQALKANPKITSFLSEPLQGMMTGAWVVVISRPILSNDGRLLGIVFASIDLGYFDDFFRSTSLGEGYAATLLRQDGALMARYPAAGKIGTVVSASVLGKLANSRSGVSRAVSPVDQQTRIAAAYRLSSYPLVVIVTQSELSAFATWRTTALTMALVTTLMIAIIAIAVYLMARSWLQQDRLNAAHAEIIESEKVRALAEAELDRQRERRHVEQQLDETRRFLDSIVENIPVAVVVKDAKTLKYILVNRAFETMLGLPRAELLGRTVFDIHESKGAEVIDAADRESIQDAAHATYREIEIEIRARGTHVQATRRIVIHDDEGEPKYLVAVIEDVTERKKTEQRVAFLAHHDALTGLANRAALTQKIDEAAARQRRRKETFSVLLLDLDRFKQVNDTLGHPAGDALLTEVAVRLKTLLRETDVLARLGGDEFAVIQSGEADQRVAAGILADRIIEALGESFDINGNDINIGTSIGIALAPEHDTGADNLLKMADLALYRAKSAGRNGYRFFDPEMSELASARHEIENDLRRAIAQNELELHYQPIIDSKSQKICSVEALVRWRHPTKGLIFPDRFIPLAEETGLIMQIGEWVLRNACAEAAPWPASVKVAVNLSLVQLRKANLPDIVTDALAKSGLPPDRLELEITETALIESAAECLPALRLFKTLGVTIVLDDFGTGYSSLSQLAMFPFDKIKIDKSFTQNLTKRSECAAIISATLTLARSLDIATTAEGVETADQCRLLRLAGVTSLQGYLFKRPGPASEIDFEASYGAPEIGAAA